ncbi:GAF and HD-GYP domain-containing protein [Noviherbaspirillum saxi]|uniref:GAF domain-containing protein n=1 Tax=Noviherbaspirillum saxi TaxID=2320863 RepID=A0A3A3FX26_9BURK|nr:HD family phosphohydrolase [Noviherbaspirillum saxi]RJF99218.1 GAF domain-containing protein [Noviherbaspirillum saxi]
MSDPSYTDIALRLERLTELSVELSTNHDIALLQERILKAAKSMTHADGGTLYRTSADRKSLSFHISINDSLGMYQGGTSGHKVDIPDIPLLTASGSKNLGAVAAYAANTGISVNIQDVYQVDVFNFSGMRKFDQQYNYHSQSFLTVPMLDHEDEVIGVLQLINAKDPATGATRAFTDTDQRFIEALASQAAIAITNSQLIARLENLFESFVKLINIGIDEKSPHTGRHCEHVPALTMMLADAVHNTEQGVFADFQMTKRDRKQLWIAGLLHDCGKITTPVHVVEKATKLETIFDRIHLLDTRFEVLKRDAEIRALKEKLSYGSDTRHHDEINRRLSSELATIDNDRNFLRHANIGTESMSADDQKRVIDIARRYTWSGPDGEERDLLDDEEVGNLNIRAGTLNSQEREIINNHIGVTIRMLESLPWPKHLQNVPEYAGGHHERMDGQGYPRGLRGDQMSVQSRMMAIADIFEALTAKDRPYKKGKSLSESLHILGGFRLRNHIDPDLFDVFIRKKVYLDYARRFMDPAQIDHVDESRIPGYVP